jgi:hypothetical protein
MSKKTQPKRLYAKNRVLTSDERRMRRGYTRVHKSTGLAKTYIRIDHQEFEICEWTSVVRANWFADMAAIALARLVKNETKGKL